MAGMRYGMTNTFQHTAKSASCPPPIAKAPLAVAHAAQILVVFSLGLNFFRSGCCSQKTHTYIHCIYRREILLKTAAAKGKIMAETIKHSVTVFFFFPAPVSIFRPLPFSLLLSLLICSPGCSFVFVHRPDSLYKVGGWLYLNWVGAWGWGLGTGDWWLGFGVFGGGAVLFVFACFNEIGTTGGWRRCRRVDCLDVWLFTRLR